MGFRFNLGHSVVWYDCLSEVLMKRVMPSYSLYMCKIEALHFFFTSDIIDSTTVGSDFDYGVDYSFLLFDAISVICGSPCAEL